MNQPLADRRSRKRNSVSGECELIAGDVVIPATLVDISFTGLRARVAPGALDGLSDAVEGVKLESLPALRITRAWSDDEFFAATYDNRELAGRVTAGFIELFTP